MPAAVAIPIIISAVASLGQAVSGYARRRKAKKALDRFKRQDLQNVTKGMRVATLGAELRSQEQARRFSTSVDALQGAGVRGLVGGLGRQEMISDVADQRTAASLDQQQMMIERMGAQDQTRMRQMQESRESGAIAGLGNEMSQGSNQMMQGAMGLAKTAVAAGQAGLFDGGEGGDGGADGGSNSEDVQGVYKTLNASTTPQSAQDFQTLQSARNYFNNNMPTNTLQEPVQINVPGSRSTINQFSGLTGNVDPVYIDQYSTDGVTFRN